MESTDSGMKEGDLERAVHVRCPQCFKLFVVAGAEIEGDKPQFQCSKCQTRFWFPFPESLSESEILGFPVAWLETPTVVETPLPPILERGVQAGRHFHCPRCQANYSAGDSECPKCGVVFAKLDFVDESRSVAASPNLRRLWHQVMSNYSSRQGHRRFVHAAQRENNLVYASQQYQRLLKAHSGDETAVQMQKEIAALTEVVEGVTRPPRSFRVRQLMPRITTLILVIGGGVIGLGFFIPEARNLIGLGVAIVFFTMAADWFFSQS